MANVRIGVMSAANIGRKVVIPSILRAENAELVALASSGDAGAAFLRESRARRSPARLLRRAPRRPGGGRRLHPAPEPPARGVVEARRRCRQARAVREAGGARRGRDGRHDRALRRPRRRLDGGVHVPLPPAVGGGPAAAATRAPSASSARCGRSSRSRCATPPNIRRRPEYGGGSLYDVGAYCVNVVAVDVRPAAGLGHRDLAAEPRGRRRGVPRRPRLRLGPGGASS